MARQVAVNHPVVKHFLGSSPSLRAKGYVTTYLQEENVSLSR